MPHGCLGDRFRHHREGSDSLRGIEELLDTDLAGVVSRARLLQEQLAGHDVGKDPLADPLVLSAWADAVAPTGTAWFEKRLEWQRALDPAEGLTGVDREWPAWLGEICEAARSGTTLSPSPLRSGQPVAFEEFLLPALVVARRRLLARLDQPGAALPDTQKVDAGAHLDLERSLLRQLVDTAGRVLDRVFARSRPPGRALLLGLGVPASSAAGRERYDDFVRLHLDLGWSGVLEEFPVLGRILATLVAQWVDATSELLQRIEEDWDSLVAVIGVEPGSTVTAIETGLGDRHRGGRTVSRLVLSNRAQLVYKPRSLAMEAQYNQLVAWTNRIDGLGPDLRAVAVLDRGTHGWCEYVAPGACVDADEVETFFERAGRLLCLLHLLRATDCHYENIVASGSHPVLVDAETLLYPDPRPLFGDTNGRGDGPLADPLVAGSVLRVGLLPQWRVGSSGAFDNSGLAGPSRRGAAPTALDWLDVNTDDMRLGPTPAREATAANLARVGDAVMSVLDHEGALVRGFTSMYGLLQENRRDFLRTGSPLDLMRTTPARFIQRSTRVYGQMIDALTEPESLADGLQAGLRLEQLARAYLPAPATPRAWPAFASEVRALIRLDVPLFEARPDSLDLRSSDGSTITSAFQRPGHEAVVARIESLDEQDRARQVDVIRLSLAARREVPSPRPARPHRPSAVLAVDDDALVAGAVSIAEQLEAVALADGAGSVTWMGVNYRAEADCQEVGVIDDFLYDGRAGVGLFAAALFANTRDDRWRQLALAALAGPRERLRHVGADGRLLAARLHGIGGASGLGSLVYALTAAGSLLDPAERAVLHGDALALAEWFTPALVADDTRLDVVAGSAGALLALALLYDATGAESARSGAVACGEHLLRSRSGRRPRAWLTVAPRRLTGFGHGAAGVSYALARLHAITGDSRYLDAAVEAIEFERRLFEPAHSTWPDLRPVAMRSEGRWPNRWCHGAGGITLARLGVLGTPAGREVPGIEGEIRAGLHAVERGFADGWDSLCCGLGGRTEAFAVASIRLGTPAYGEMARRGAVTLLHGLRQGLRLPAPHGTRPGLFQGVSGVGHQLLRVADPGLPSLLLSE